MDRRSDFEAVYAELGPAVRTFVHRRIDPTMADDLVGEVFLAAWRRFDEAPADRLPWLLGIARGVLANQRRGETRRASLHQRLIDHARQRELMTEPPADESPVLQALSTLSERDQEVLLLIAWDELDRNQAARVLKMSAPQLAVRLHRARRRLQKALEDQQRQPTPLHPAKTTEVL